MAVFGELHKSIFVRSWPYWVGGLGLACIAIFLWCAGHPWGVIGGYRNWGDWVLYGLGVYKEVPLSPLLDFKSCMAGGLVLGSFAAALIAGEFGLRMPTWWELGKGFAGGICMGFGAVLAGGCNVGGFYSNVAALSLSGFIMWAGLLGGAVLGLKFLNWEMESMPAAILGSGIKIKPAGPAWKAVQPYLGGAILLGALLLPGLYARHFYTKIGLVLLLGILSGFVMNRSRFCFAAAFRDPFMVGQGSKVRAMFLSVMIYTVGVSLLKWRGFVPEAWYVFSTAGWGAIVGGVIFGFGMILAGGCGTGTLFRVGEGQIKLMAALVTMALSNSLTKHYLTVSFGDKVFLPDFLGSWTAALVLAFGIMFFWLWAASWNEESQKLVLF